MWQQYTFKWLWLLLFLIISGCSGGGAFETTTTDASSSSSGGTGSTISTTRSGTLSVISPMIVPAGTASAVVKVAAYDATGLPMSEVPLLVSAVSDAGTVSAIPVSPVTNSTGSASFTVSADAGVVTVNVGVDTTKGSFSFTGGGSFVIYFGASISGTTVIGSPQPANGTSAITVQVRVQDSRGFPLAKIPAALKFEENSPAFLLTNASVTDENGLFSAEVASAVKSTTVVTPLIDKYSAESKTLEFSASATTTTQTPASVDVIVVNNSAAPDGSTAIKLIAIARDSANVPIPEVDVTIASSSRTAVVDKVVGTTGAQAKFDFAVTNTVQEDVTLTITAGTGAGKKSATQVISFKANNTDLAVSSVKTEVSGNSDGTLANGIDTALVTVTVLGANNTPISGVNVGFIVPVSALKLSPATGTTDQTGRFSTQVSSDLVGTFTINTIANGVLRDSATLTFGSASGTEPSVVEITVSNAPQPADGISTVNIFAVARDKNKTPMGNVRVALSSSSPFTKLGKYGDNAALLSANYAEARTETSGATAFILTSSRAGTVQITASLPDFNVASVTGNITFDEAPVRTSGISSVTLTSDLQSQVANGKDSVNIAAIVRDNEGVPVSNVTVSLATNPTSSGAVFDAASGTTGNNGVFKTTVTNTKVETVSIIATAVETNGNSIKSSAMPLQFVTDTGSGVGVIPTTLRLEVAGSPAVPDGKTEVSLRTLAFDANGRTLPGAAVSVEVTAIDKPSPLFVFNDKSSGTTADNGAFDTKIISTTGGSLQLTAVSGNVRSNTVTVTFVAAAAEQPASLTLLASNPELPSHNPAEGVVLTALVKTTANTPFASKKVNFSADSGLITPLQTEGASAVGLTNPAGSAQARLGTGGDPSIRSIKVKAQVDGVDCTKPAEQALCKELTIQVTGTQLKISDLSSKNLVCKTSNYVITLTDADDKAIANKSVELSLTGTAGSVFVSDTNGTACPLPNIGATRTLSTDAQGRVSVVVQSVAAGSSTLTAKSLGASATSTVKVENVGEIVGIAPLYTDSGSAPYSVNLFTAARFGVRLDPIQNINPITVSTTRGHLASTAQDCDPIINTASFTGISPNEVANANVVSNSVLSVGLNPLATQSPVDANFEYNAEFYICSNNLGPATIRIQTAQGTQESVELTFVPKQAEVLTIQANPTSIAPNALGSETQQSEIIVIARDKLGNLVPNQTIFFVVEDQTGGRLAQPSAVTDRFGRATTVYIAGNSTSAAGGVKVTASLTTRPPQPVTATLTVGQRAAFIILGTGNSISEDGSTRYSYPYTALVTDIEGNPIANAVISLSTIPSKYYYGCRTKGTTDDAWTTRRTYVCNNNDLDRDALLDQSEFFNNNNMLDPRNVATFKPSQIKTGETGFADFSILYPQEYAGYIDLEVKATTVVAGSESIATADFRLTGLTTDFAGDQAPPGPISPYGVVPKLPLVAPPEMACQQLMTDAQIAALQCGAN